MSRPPDARRAIALLALAAAALATLATTPASLVTRIDGPVVSGTLTMDAEHPMAVQRFTVRLNEVASAAPRTATIEVGRDGSPSVRLTVVPIRAAVEAGLVSPYPRAYEAAGSEGALVVEAGSTQTFQLDCDTPCERSFRVIAEQTGSAGSATVTWNATGSLAYQGEVWPSGAAMAIRVDAAVAIGGAGRSLSAAIPTEQIVLDATRPAAARLVEVRMAAAAVPARMSDVISTAVLEASFGAAVPDGSVANPYYGVSFHQVSPAATAGNMIPGLPQFDPFGGCAPGSDCVRTYLLTARWLGGKTETIDWGLHLSQIRLQGEAAPAGSLQIRVLRSFDIASDAPQRLHFEGDVTLTPGDGRLREQSTWIGVAVEPVDPAAEWPVPFDLVPVPGVASFAASLASGTTLDPRDILYHSVYGYGPMDPPGEYDAPLVVAEPFSDEHPSQTEPLLVRILIGVNQEAAALTAPVIVHWTLDFDIYGYDGLPRLRAVSVPTKVSG